MIKLEFQSKLGKGVKDIEVKEFNVRVKNRIGVKFGVGVELGFRGGCYGIDLAFRADAFTLLCPTGHITFILLGRLFEGKIVL